MVAAQWAQTRVNDELYALLEVERAASARMIQSAYRRLARAYHPDRNPAPDAAERFKAVAAAYAVLSDSARRRAYDRWGQGTVGQVDERASARPEADVDVAFE
jgi:curved DNA-binding protein